MLDINLLYDVQLARNFSHLLGCFFFCLVLFLFINLPLLNYLFIYLPLLYESFLIPQNSSVN